MEEFSSKLDSLITQQEEILERLKAKNEATLTRYIRKIEDFKDYLRMQVNDLIQKIHTLESDYNRFTKSVEKKSYEAQKIEKEVQRRKALVTKLIDEFEKIRLEERTKIDEELRQYRMDAAQGMLTEFNEVSIPERSIDLVIDMILQICKYRNNDKTVRDNFMNLTKEVVGGKMDSHQEDLFASNSNQLDIVTRDLNEKFDLLESAANDMKKRANFMRSLQETRKLQEEKSANSNLSKKRREQTFFTNSNCKLNQSSSSTPGCAIVNTYQVCDRKLF